MQIEINHKNRSFTLNYNMQYSNKIWHLLVRHSSTHTALYSFYSKDEALNKMIQLKNFWEEN